MKKILILGANSFAGTSFVNFLLKKNTKFFPQADQLKKENLLISLKKMLTKIIINLKKLI